ncbi:MAG: TetR/AcrR family transcriptional regulator [Propionibacteriales bacterium]|nr:TetR/AcrR family transcriptional regulator [Propionibacteriales bacterium]
MPRRPDDLRPRKSPRQERSRATQQRILVAAARVFADEGYPGTTTDRIAHAAGLSVGSLYQYFGNKDAILHVLALSHLDQADQAIRAALTDGKGGHQRWLPRLVEVVIASHRESPALQRVIFDQAPRSAELVARFEESQQAAVTAIAELLRTDEIHPITAPDTTALLVAASIESLTHRFIGSAAPITTEALAEELIMMVASYVAAAAGRCGERGRPQVSSS